ncbi:hypothetical protein G9A89_003250 [Geosiphon pyriformis]|nr:hypothetical protein G9A89_003250 [Geosiphon pyriformis]
MAYAPIAKLDNFTGKENDAQIWLNNVEKAIAANGWNDARSLVNKPQDFNAFKAEFLRYFSNNNSINRLVNAFTIIKQEETEAILNQFIRGLCSSILQHVWPLHPDTFQDAVTCTRDFESAKSEANHTQAINLVINGSSELDSKLEKFRSRTWNLDTSRVQNPNSQHYLSFLVTPENATSNNTESNQHIPINTIPLATISSNKSLAAIFPFELKENAPIPLFSRAALEEKPITAMYMDARVDVDRAASARIITANGVTKTPIGEINDFPFEVNGIVTPIKVLVIEATQYQALLTYQGQHIHVPAMCGHFKTPPREKLLIELEEEKEKPTWKAYQHNELPPILSWNDNNKGKGKQKEELTWETDDLTWTNNNKTGNRKKKKKIKGKEKKNRPLKPPPLITPTLHHNDLPIKLSSMGTCCGDDEEYSMATRFYCCPCILEHFGRPKQVGKWDNQPCLACGETLLDKGITCDVLCQYTILISDWVKKGTPIEAAWRRAIQRLDSCPHDNNKIWQMALAKIKGAIQPPEPLELDWDTEPIINLLDPEQFHKHYQELAPTREEQEQ